MLNLIDGKTCGLVIVDPKQPLMQNADYLQVTTLETVKSNEEFVDEGISTVKTTTKLRPDFSSYNTTEDTI